jgi:hypothetical protein
MQTAVSVHGVEDEFLPGRKKNSFVYSYLCPSLPTASAVQPGIRSSYIASDLVVVFRELAGGRTMEKKDVRSNRERW